MRLPYWFCLALLIVTGCLPARADIGLMLNAKPNGHVEIGFAEITGEGHSAVYLSRVCPESPVKLRLCNPGELGSIIQNYVDYKEDLPYQWNIVPLSVYLYGVDDVRQKPLFASPEVRTVLQDRYRRLHMQDVCTTQECITDPEANWRDAIAAAFVREIYMFEVRTSVEQDEQFIREFNARANVNHYSGFTRNCADFAKLVVNTYFPHSAHRDPINDFGMTGPKAIARSFAHYAEHHPELELRVVRIDQVPGTYKRSSDCHEGTEQTFRAKKWLVPMIAVEAQAVPVLAASYLLTGRFDPNHELRNHPSSEAALLHQQMAEAREAKDHARPKELKRQLKAEQQRQLGSDEQWQQYRERFQEILRTAVADGVLTHERQVSSAFRDLQARGRMYLDDRQQPWLEINEEGRVRRVGLSADNILDPGSDHELAMKLLLARTSALLSANSKHRELWPDFQNDWALLQTAEARARPRTGPDIAASATQQ
jgi:hypothetical protein